MAKFYATLIKNGKFSLENVPKLWYTDVVELLKHWED
ncbi:CD1375 family protein [Lactococcus garvieae]|uniref:Uncharacterized protein n=1 Tax=Lactococcus garvieae TaxID=1363 RepID=A0A1I4J3G9_9LACT|nr:CD1375 family protein [Lactococcus garvieae]SFL60787.1 hypothetical protein SAMN05216438_1277 [Lactococcus garvieae]